MDRFETTAITHMLVVSDIDKSRDEYVNALEASVYGEYGGPRWSSTSTARGFSCSQVADRMKANRPCTFARSLSCPDSTDYAGW